MNIIIRGRGEGKTTELIKRAHEIDGYIVCHSQEAVILVVCMAKEMGLHIRFPITYDEMLQYTGFRHIPFLIDNAELLLQYISSNRIDTITLSTSEPKP